MTDDDRVFKALADPTRRFLLDRLFARDGRTLTELESELEMTRFGVMKHLRVLEDAGLVVTRRSGREKLHFLNPVPIRLIHDRWIDKYTERQVSALADLKTRAGGNGMTTMTETDDDHAGLPGLHQGDAGGDLGRDHQARVDRALRLRRPRRRTTCGRAARTATSPSAGDAGARACPRSIVDGEVIEADPPRKLVQTWRMLMDRGDGGGGLHAPHLGDRAEGAGGVTRLTVIHELEGAPKLAAMVAGELEEHRRRRRLELGPQRPQDAARDRQLDGMAAGPGPRLNHHGGDPAPAGSPPRGP